jgi:hypothetical protein
MLLVSCCLSRRQVFLSEQAERPPDFQCTLLTLLLLLLLL